MPIIEVNHVTKEYQLGHITSLKENVANVCNGQVKQDTLLSRLFIKFPLILNRGLIA